MTTDSKLNDGDYEMATHSSILSWKIPWTEEPGKLQSMGLKRVGHDWATSLSLSLSSMSSREMYTELWEPKEEKGQEWLSRGADS